MNLKTVKSELRAVWEGVALSAPSALVAPLNLFVVPWAAGRQAGIGAYKQKAGLGDYQASVRADTFEGHSLRQSYKNLKKEGLGIVGSASPVFLSLPLMSALQQAGVPDNFITGLMASILVSGGYMASRFYSQAVLAPHYAESFDQGHDVLEDQAASVDQDDIQPQLP